MNKNFMKRLRVKWKFEHPQFQGNWANSICWWRPCDFFLKLKSCFHAGFSKHIFACPCNLIVQTLAPGLNGNLHQKYLSNTVLQSMSNPLLRRVKYFPQFDPTVFSILLCLDPQLRLLYVNSHITFSFPLILKWFSFSSALKSLLTAAFIKAVVSSRASSLLLLLWDNKRIEDYVCPLICRADVTCHSLDENNIWKCDCVCVR